MERKAVLITGASSGIGESMAIHLDSVGYRVILVARRLEKLNEIAAKLSDDTVCIAYDLQDLEGIEKIFLQLKENNIKLYGLVHCAGINRDRPVKMINLDDMIQVMNLNLLSFIQLAKFFCQKKYSEDGGAMIAMSSNAVHICEKSMCTYSASKAGVDAAVRVMSKEFAKRGMRVNSIQSAFVDTDMARATVDYESKFDTQPLGVIEPVYVAYLAEFLLSDKSKYISGSNIKMSSAAN